MVWYVWSFSPRGCLHTQHLASRAHSCEFKSGQVQCVFFNLYALSKFILDVTDIGEGKPSEKTWAYNQCKSEIANPSCASVVINAYAYVCPVWEQAFARLMKLKRKNYILHIKLKDTFFWVLRISLPFGGRENHQMTSPAQCGVEGCLNSPEIRESPG